MIKQVNNKEQLNVCLDIIHRSFITVAEEFGLTENNCPSHTSFMTICKLEKQFDDGRPMFLFYQDSIPVGYFSLAKYNDEEWELINLAVLPEYRHLGIGQSMINFAVITVKNYGGKKISIGIIEENSILKNWYLNLGFKHISKRKFKHLPFTVGHMELNIKNTVSFEFLNNPHFSTVATEIFDILADNMEKIAPTGNTRDEDYRYWFDGVSNGLMRDERQIVLIKDSGSIIGFFQYYTNADTFMMEEIQIKPEYQGKNIFRKLYGFLIENISKDILFVEAYANIANHKSIGILEKFGLSKIGTNKNGRCLHFKGKYSDLLKWYESK